MSKIQSNGKFKNKKKNASKKKNSRDDFFK